MNFIYKTTLTFITALLLLSCRSTGDRVTVNEGGTTIKEISGQKTVVYRINSEESFRITIPEEWEAQLGQDNYGNRIISYQVNSGEESFMLTIRPQAVEKELEELKYNLEVSGRELLNFAKEEYIDLKDLEGKKVKGYYYSLTNKAYDKENAGDNDFPCLTNCNISGGGRTYTITILTHSLTDGLLQKLLETVSTIE